ncbi:circadian clock protein KaiC [Actinomadura sp. K4S16]|uniref:circadian clock protein KaiC n=1 Tax=Actinomadura sp. K4S16 TaxID=1316147 RepID=UPI0011ECD793|nr:circadian clock protein KaiC [Actinomadura sp. K4S16]
MVTEVRRTPTGISGFDEVAVGGLPAGRSTLVTGTAGSGKTLFALEFLARGIMKYEEPGVFVTFDETPEDLRSNVASLGFDIAHWERDGKWVFVDVSAVQEEMFSVGGYDLGGLIARVEHAVAQVGAGRISLDSLGTLLIRFQDRELIRRELARLTRMLESLGVTSVLTTERDTEYDGLTRHGVEEFALDNVLIIRNVLRNERRRRTLEIVKFRGTTHRTGEWLFTIDPTEGLVVVPLAFLAPREQASRARVSTGTPGLDEMVGGGIFRDALALVTGPPGSGKTLMALQFADAAFQAAERSLFYVFDETRDQLYRSAAGWDMDLEAMESSGLLRITAGYPEEASVEDHFLSVRRDIADFAPSRLIIDSLSALERRGAPRTLLDFVIALGALAREHEITTLFTSSTSSDTWAPVPAASAMEVASITDVTILLRYAENAGVVQRIVAVLQSRGSPHDPTVRRVGIDHAGLRVGDPYTTGSRLFPDPDVPPPDRRPER